MAYEDYWFPCLVCSWSCDDITASTLLRLTYIILNSSVTVLYTELTASAVSCENSCTYNGLL